MQKLRAQVGLGGFLHLPALLSNTKNPEIYGDSLFHLNVVDMSRSMSIP